MIIMRSEEVGSIACRNAMDQSVMNRLYVEAFFHFGVWNYTEMYEYGQGQ